MRPRAAAVDSRWLAPVAAAVLSSCRLPLPELAPPPAGIRANDWNLLSVTMDANIIRPILNQSYNFIPGATDERDDYGPIALYVGGAADVHFKDVALKDLYVREIAPERTSPRFRMQRLDEFYYAWGAAAADFNNDGVLDVVAGPHYYLGPAYTSRREIDAAPAQSPSASFARTMIDYAYDFTGDGWADVLAGESRPMHLYVNPKGANRRWAKHSVLPQITSELALMRDIDGDGRPEILFGTGGVGGTLAFGWPDPAKPTAPWLTHTISEPGPAHGHGLGAGDVNGDGRIDVLQAAGWWEQPDGRRALRPLEVPPVHVRAMGPCGRRRRRRDGRVQRERRRVERRRRRGQRARIRAGVVSAETGRRRNASRSIAG